MDILRILENSSLRTLVSSQELDEIAEELTSGIEEILEEEKDNIREKFFETYKVQYLTEENKRLNAIINSSIMPRQSLDDIMTAEWVKEYWEEVKKMQKDHRTDKRRIFPGKA